MGDRGQIKMVERDGGVYLYTHWGATELKDLVRKVLSRRLRWGDSTYLARMFFCEMVKDDLDGELGYGITTYEAGDAWLTIEVNCDEANIKIIEHDEPVFEGTFEEFLNTGPHSV